MFNPHRTAARWARWGAGVAVLAMLGGLSPQVAAEERLFAARVYLDRANPERTVPIFDFRINQTPTHAGGVQYVILHSSDGTLNMPFELISEITINRSLGHSGEIARYDATVRLKQGREAHTGRLDLHILHGRVDSIPWHLLLTSSRDRGVYLSRIVFVDQL